MAKLAWIGALLAAVATTAALHDAAPAGAADRDCSDFPSQRAAQNYFLAKGGPRRDPDHLDSDGDGTACETLPCPCRYGSGGGGRPARRIKARIVHVVDGDTVRVRARHARRRRYDVRLIGIDTPEKYGGRECGSAGASRSMRRLAPVGLRVRLLTDPSQDAFDRYGRLLAYVVRHRDGRDLGRTQTRPRLGEGLRLRAPLQAGPQLPPGGSPGPPGRPRRLGALRRRLPSPSVGDRDPHQHLPRAVEAGRAVLIADQAQGARLGHSTLAAAAAAEPAAQRTAPARIVISATRAMPLQAPGARVSPLPRSAGALDEVGRGDQPAIAGADHRVGAAEIGAAAAKATRCAGSRPGRSRCRSVSSITLASSWASISRSAIRSEIQIVSPPRLSSSCGVRSPAAVG